MYKLYAVDFVTEERFLIGEYEKWIDGCEADSMCTSILNAVYTVLENDEEEKEGSGL